MKIGVLQLGLMVVQKEARRHVVLRSIRDRSLHCTEGQQDENAPFLSSQALWSCARHCEPERDVSMRSLPHVAK